jgi:hypothetical protein
LVKFGEQISDALDGALVPFDFADQPRPVASAISASSVLSRSSNRGM